MTAADWIASGAASLTGWPDGPGLVPPPGVLDRIRQLGRAAGVDPFAALTERAAIAGLHRQGDVSCGGATRLVRAADGWVAVSLAREDDVAAVAAWLELDDDPGVDPWPAITATLPQRRTADVTERAILLGLPVAEVPREPPASMAATPAGAREPAGAGDPASSGDPAGTADPPDAANLPGRWQRLGPAGRPPRSPPLVVDLSSLWAGPVCARVLIASGADVVKVESIRRPDGARQGPVVFFDRLHTGQRSVALDFASPAGRRALRALVTAADVVIEASRPRALEQLGVRPVDLGSQGPSVWVSITGYGRGGPAAARVAFGDDAAAGAGLVAPTSAGPVFVADAIADPLTGLAGAAAATSALRRGGRWLVDVSLAAVAAWVAAGDPATQGASHDRTHTPMSATPTPWSQVAAPPSPPPVDPPDVPAPALGAHTSEVLAALDGVPA